MLFLSALIFSAFIWTFACLFYFFKTNSLKLFHFPFSEKNYYLLLSGIPLSVVSFSILTHSMQPLAAFIFFAITGVLGETLFSLWWHSFFGKRFWVYTTDTIYHGYTSALNFIPWGVAGLLSKEIAQIVLGKSLLTTVFTNPLTYILLALIYFGSLALQIIIFALLYEFHLITNKFHHVTLMNYFFFIFPILAIIVFLGLRYSYNFFLLAIIFGSFFALIEYAFGKATQLFISKKLWDYTYETYDNQHFSPLAIIPFMISGFWFVIVIEFFKTFLFV